MKTIPVLHNVLLLLWSAAAQTVELEGLNHFFQTARTGSFMEIGQIEETFSPKALERIDSWISARASDLKH